MGRLKLSLIKFTVTRVAPTLLLISLYPIPSFNSFFTANLFSIETISSSVMAVFKIFFKSSSSFAFLAPVKTSPQIWFLNFSSQFFLLVLPIGIVYYTNQKTQRVGTRGRGQFLIIERVFNNRTSFNNRVGKKI